MNFADCTKMSIRKVCEFDILNVNTHDFVRDYDEFIKLLKTKQLVTVPSADKVFDICKIRQQIEVTPNKWMSISFDI